MTTPHDDAPCKINLKLVQWFLNNILILCSLHNVNSCLVYTNLNINFNCIYLFNTDLTGFNTLLKLLEEQEGLLHPGCAWRVWSLQLDWEGKKGQKTCGHLTHDFGLDLDGKCQNLMMALPSLGSTNQVMMINTFWPKFFCHVSFLLCGILFVAMAAVPVSDALMWLLEEKKLCLFRWYHGESGRQEWMGLTHCGKLIFRRITKVAKNVVWSCDLVQTKLVFYLGPC